MGIATRLLDLCDQISESSIDEEEIGEAAIHKAIAHAANHGYGHVSSSNGHHVMVHKRTGEVLHLHQTGRGHVRWEQHNKEGISYRKGAGRGNKSLHAYLGSYHKS